MQLPRSTESSMIQAGRYTAHPSTNQIRPLPEYLGYLNSLNLPGEDGECSLTLGTLGVLHTKQVHLG